MGAKKPSRGGRREGAGRKPLLRDRRAIKVSMDGDTYEQLHEAALERETSMGELARKAIEAYLKRIGTRRKQ